MLPGSTCHAHLHDLLHAFPCNMTEYFNPNANIYLVQLTYLVNISFFFIFAGNGITQFVLHTHWKIQLGEGKREHGRTQN